MKKENYEEALAHLPEARHKTFWCKQNKTKIGERFLSYVHRTEINILSCAEL